MSLAHDAARLARRRHDESGSIAAELVLVTPLLILLLLFVVALGRLASARIDVNGAAAVAARAASIARDPTAATATAQQTASAALAGDGVACASLNVATDTAAFAPGGEVAVTVTCAVDFADLAGLHIPAATTVSSSSMSVVDTYRQATP